MQKSGLSNIQIELLKLYAANVSDATLLEVKQVLADYFAKKLDEETEDFFNKNNINSNDIATWAYEHNRVESGNRH